MSNAKNEEARQDAIESALHDEVNRLCKEHREKNEAAEAQARHDKSQKAYQSRQRAKKDRFKLMAHRMGHCLAIGVIAVSWFKAGIIGTPAAVLGVVVATIWAVLEVRLYSAYKGWTK